LQLDLLERECLELQHKKTASPQNQVKI